MGRIRLGFYTDFLAAGAAESYLCWLAEGINKEVYDPAFLCPGEPALRPVVERMARLGVLTEQFSLGGHRNTLSLVRAISRLFERQNLQIVHVNNLTPTGILAAAWARVPMVVVTIHTPALNPRFNWKGRLLQWIALRFRATFVVLSETNRELAIRKYSLRPEQVTIVYPGLPGYRFYNSYDRDATLREFDISNDAPVVGTVGRLTAQKAQQYFIDAARIVRQVVPGTRFVIVGDGELREDLITYCKGQGLEDAVIFTGYRTDVIRIMSTFHVFALSSLYEGLPFVILEAMALSKPVVSTAVDGVCDAVVDGKTGLLVPPRDPHALANAIIWMLRHPQQARAMGEAGRHRFEVLFTQERMVESTEALYRRLLADKRLAQSAG
jgi:glycosyltransferase involved in cell wall biosynthesis